MSAGVIFLTGFVVYALVVGDPDEKRIEAKLDKQLDLLNEQIAQNGIVSSAAACVAYQNHRAIEQAALDAARLAAGIASDLPNAPRVAAAPPDPRVLPSNETIDACREVNIEIDDAGVPELSPAPGGTPEADQTDD